jgi:hypothetical protein
MNNNVIDMEAKRKEMDKKTKVEEMTDRYIEIVKVLPIEKQKTYKYWLDTYGGPHIVEWMNTHGYDISAVRTGDFIAYMATRFVEWANEIE